MQTRGCAFNSTGVVSPGRQSVRVSIHTGECIANPLPWGMGVRLIAHGGLAIHHETRGQCHIRLTLADRSEIENGLRSNRGGSVQSPEPRRRREAPSFGRSCPTASPATRARRAVSRTMPQPQQVRQEIPMRAGRTGELRPERGATLHNLTQRLPWTGRRWKKLTEWNARLCGKNARLSHLKVRLLLRRCVYFFKFPDFGRRAVRVLSCVIFLW